MRREDKGCGEHYGVKGVRRHLESVEWRVYGSANMRYAESVNESNDWCRNEKVGDLLRGEIVQESDIPISALNVCVDGGNGVIAPGRW